MILSEDSAKYMDIRSERNDPGPIVNGSRQIYLTFPSESTFTEEDVSNYFRLLLSIVFLSLSFSFSMNLSNDSLILRVVSSDRCRM